MVVIGLGNAGCAVAKLFKKHKTYQVVLLDGGKGIDKCETVEGYDQIEYKPPKTWSKKHKEALVITCGSGKVSGAILRILEPLKELRTTVCYIVPELDYLSSEAKKRNRVHFNVLQEFTRSGMIDEMILFDNELTLENFGHGSIKEYYDQVNHYYYSALHMNNFSKNVDPVFGEHHTSKEISRITTLGLGHLEDSSEKLLFPLDNITETCYIINVSEDDLNTNDDIIPSIKDMATINKEKNRETSFAVFETPHETHFYVKHFTHFLQEK
tara:strand:+ start:1799 stop:2605 length:807 start_codon:yes stop_codon:yes gene_type:complete